MYVENTSLFADVGKLQVGKEIVGYERRLEDRFLDVTRGLDGTEATAHPAGQYIRTIPDSVRVIDAGPRSVVVIVESVAQSSETITNVTSTIQSIHTAEIVKEDLTEQIEYEVNHYIEYNDDDYVTVLEVALIPPTSSNSVLMSAESVSVFNTSIHVEHSASVVPEKALDLHV